MKLSIEIDVQAKAEFVEACDFYRSRREGLDKRFSKKIEAVIQAIRSHPKRHPKVFGETRKCVIVGYPFCIYYRLEPTAIFIVSVFHTSRDPKNWQSRS